MKNALWLEHFLQSARVTKKSQYTPSSPATQKAHYSWRLTLGRVDILPTVCASEYVVWLLAVQVNTVDVLHREATPE